MARLTFENIVLEDNICYIDNKEVALTKNEYILLKYLMEHKGKFYTKPEIIQNVLKSHVSFQAVTTLVSRLRDKLGDSRKYLVTKFGFGYGLRA